MELRQLAVFVAVAEEMSITRAADRQNVVQSAVSATLRTLERQLGVELVSRTTHKVELTDAGRLFLPEAAKKAETEFKAVADEFSKKSIHQKFEVGRIDLQRLDGGVVMSHVVGQVVAQAQIGDEQVSQPQPLTLNLKLVRNPYLGRNQRYPFAVAEYGFGQAEQLPVQKGKEK